MVIGNFGTFPQKLETLQHFPQNIPPIILKAYSTFSHISYISWGKANLVWLNSESAIVISIGLLYF